MSDILVTPSPSQRIIVQQGGPVGPPGQNATQEIMAIREGQPPCSALLFWYVFAQAETIDLVNSRMEVGIAPAADWTAPVTSNGMQVGYWQVPAGTTTGVLYLLTPAFSGGSDLRVIAPLVQDTALSDTLIIMALEN